MSQTTLDFYDHLADFYHLIFDDWDESINRQALALDRLLVEQTQQSSLDLLDCTCGIGTQAIGLAQKGHRVVASDLSRSALNRAKHEAEVRGLDISFFVSDMTSLEEIAKADFDVVAAFDNALPHLTAAQVRKAVRAMGSKLKPFGLFIASVRDYDKLILQRPRIHEPAFYGKDGGKRIVHQVWEWIDDTSYIVHLYITTQSGGNWASHHFAAEYRCLLRNELSSALASAGFEQVQWLMPDESSFYQPIVLAKMGNLRMAAE
jgi:glycine/sarcosine N-methyltransferase